MSKITIDDTLDPNFKFEIAARPGGENIRKCFACGTCTAGCPVYHVEHAYNPRRIIRMILLGMRKEVLSSPMIWLCSQCYTCSANCPQGVDFSDIMFALRDLAVKEGYAPAALRERIEAAGTLANELRRDLIKLIMAQEGVSAEAIREHFEAELERLTKDR